MLYVQAAYKIPWFNSQVVAIQLLQNAHICLSASRTSARRRRGKIPLSQKIAAQLGQLGIHRRTTRAACPHCATQREAQ